MSVCCSGQKLSTQPAKMTLTGRRTGAPTYSGYLKLGSVCKLRVGSYGFPIVLRELGTRHASTQRINPVETVAPPGDRLHYM